MKSIIDNESVKKAKKKKETILFNQTSRNHSLQSRRNNIKSSSEISK